MTDEGLMIPVPSWVIVQSARYAWTRRTYAVEQTAEHLRDVWPYLPEGPRNVMLRDLEGAIDLRYGVDGPEQMDVVTLINLRDDLRRMDEVKHE